MTVRATLRGKRCGPTHVAFCACAKQKLLGTNQDILSVPEKLSFELPRVKGPSRYGTRREQHQSAQLGEEV